MPIDRTQAARSRPVAFRRATAMRAGVSVAMTFGVWVFIPSYGAYRLRQSKESMTEGPILAVIQNDVPTEVGGSLGAGSDPNVLLQDLLDFSSEQGKWPRTKELFDPYLQ